MPSGKQKLKQRGTATYLLEWSKHKALTTPNAGGRVHQQEPSLVTGGNTKWHSHFGRQLGGFLQN